MHLELHRKTPDGDLPIMVCADDIQTVEYNPTGTIIHLVGGAVIIGISESPREIINFLMENLEERWG